MAAAHFPESNAFGRTFYRLFFGRRNVTWVESLDVVNGEQNVILVAIESKETDRNVTLKSIGGSLHNAQTEKLVKNVRVPSFSMCCVCRHPVFS